MTAHGPSSDPTGGSRYQCVYCGGRPPFHHPSCRLHHAYLTGNPGGPLTADSQESEHSTEEAAERRDAGSSCRTGTTASRSWSVTVSWTSGCLRVTLAKSDSTSPPARSGSGTVGIRTSGSSKSWIAEDAFTGTAPDAESQLKRIVDRLIPVLTDLRGAGRISRNDMMRIANAVISPDKKETP